MSAPIEAPWTWRELGEFLGLKRSATKALIASSDIPCVYASRSRRFIPSEVHAWFLKQRTPAGGAQLTHPGRKRRKVA
jgi:hypothetical protein